MGLRFLIVDDHAMFRIGIRLLLQSRYPDAELAEADDGATAVQRANELKPDLLIVDLHLPDQDGIEVSRRILACAPAAKIVILSADLDLSHVNEALKAGVSAYLLKTNTPEELPRPSTPSWPEIFTCAPKPTQRRSRIIARS